MKKEMNNAMGSQDAFNFKARCFEDQVSCVSSNCVLQFVQLAYKEKLKI